MNKIKEFFNGIMDAWENWFTSFQGAGELVGVLIVVGAFLAVLKYFGLL